MKIALFETDDPDLDVIEEHLRSGWYVFLFSKNPDVPKHLAIRILEKCDQKIMEDISNFYRPTEVKHFRDEEAVHAAARTEPKSVAIFDWDKTMALGVPPGEHFLDSNNLQRPYPHMVETMKKYIDLGWEVYVLTNRADKVSDDAPKSSIIIRGYLADVGIVGVDIRVAKLGGRRKKGSNHKIDTFVEITAGASAIVHYEDDLRVLTECSKVATCKYEAYFVKGPDDIRLL
jgi:hypothetical protein